MLDNEETRAILALLSASVITQLHKLERMRKQVVSQEEQEDGNWNIEDHLEILDAYHSIWNLWEHEVRDDSLPPNAGK
jgi:hypothetical protein